jgi:hypothetical protein
MATVDPIENQTKRSRSMPYRGSFYVATFWTLFYIFWIITTITAVVMFLLYHKNNPSHFFLYTVVIGVLFSLLSLIISFFKRRKALCPLCRGTPLLNNGARVHQKSLYIPPLNHGYTAIVSIVFTQKFCCMYCGTKYDLLKESSKKRSARYESDSNQP